MLFLLNSFYYSFSKNYIEKYNSKNKKEQINETTIVDDPIIIIDINFDNINIIDDYITNNELVDIIINNTIKRIPSHKSIISEFDIDYSFEFNCGIYEKLSFSESRN